MNTEVHAQSQATTVGTVEVRNIHNIHESSGVVKIVWTMKSSNQIAQFCTVHHGLLRKLGL